MKKAETEHGISAHKTEASDGLLEDLFAPEADNFSVINIFANKKFGKDPFDPAPPTRLKFDQQKQLE